MQIVKLIKTASPEANILAVVSAILLLIKILILNRIRALFTGAYELGIFVEGTLASVIASYIFYLLVVHVKEQSDQAVLQPYIEKHAKRVVGDCVSQLNELSKSSGSDLALGNLSLENITSAFTKIAPYSQAPLIISTNPNTYANWFQYLGYHKSRSKESIRKLFDQLKYLDAKLVSLVASIDDCSHFNQMDIPQNTQVNNDDMAAWAKSFYDYCVLCNNLNSYLVDLGYLSAVS